MTYAGDYTPADFNETVPEDIRHDSAPVTSPSTHTSATTQSTLRIVVGPDGKAYPDFNATLPGKAVDLPLSKAAIIDAIDRHILGANTDCTDLIDMIEKALKNRALGMISIARKAGALAVGTEKAEEMIKSGKAAIYLTASPAGSDTRNRLTYHTHATGAVLVDLFTTEELSKACGTEKVMHAALIKGGIAQKFLAETCRTAEFYDKTLTTNPKKGPEEGKDDR